MKFGVLTIAAIAASTLSVPAFAATFAGPNYVLTQAEARALNGKQFENDLQLNYFRLYGKLPVKGAPIILTTPEGPQELPAEPDVLPVAGAVPEPATWAMMIGGFGLTGFAMRRRQAAVAA